MKAEQVQPVKTAPTPFSYLSADLILRSVDDVDFYVHAVILRQCSRHFFFSTEFLDSKDKAEIARCNDHICLPVTETSFVLERVLRFCYLLADPTIETLDEVCEVIAAMDRYRMDCSPAARRAGNLLLRDDFIHCHPLRVFTIAYHYRWQDILTAAAQASTRIPLSAILQSPPFEEQCLLTATATLRLLDYRHRCASAVSLAARRFGTVMHNPALSRISQVGIPHCSRHSAIRSSLCGGEVDSVMLLTEDVARSVMIADPEAFTYSWLFDFTRDAAQVLKSRPGIAWNSNFDELLWKYRNIALGCECCQAIAHTLDGKDFQAGVRKAIWIVSLELLDEKS